MVAGAILFERRYLTRSTANYARGRYAALLLAKVFQPPFIKNLFARTSEFLKASRKRPFAQAIQPASAPGSKKTKSIGAAIGGIISQFSLVGGFVVEEVSLPGKRGAGIRRKRWPDDEAEI